MHTRLPKHFVLEERLERYADGLETNPRAYRGRWAEACHVLEPEHDPSNPGGMSHLTGTGVPDEPVNSNDPGNPSNPSGVANSDEPGNRNGMVNPNGIGDTDNRRSLGDSGTPSAYLPRYREVRLDLGCGKGVSTVKAAQREPDVLFVGVDYEPLCMAYAAQHACESGLHNVVFVPGKGSDVRSFFAEGELAAIYLNFPTPFPRAKKAPERLTYLDRLMDYRHVLAPGGFVQLKTDSQPLRDFTLTQLALANYEVLWSTDDCRALLPNDPVSAYEARLTAQGATVYGIRATPGPEPAHVEQTAKLGLVDYLPEDLSAMAYVPHGMERTVINIRNLEAKGRSRDEAIHLH